MGGGEASGFLLLLSGLKHFDVYIGSGAPLVVYTDYSPVTFLRSM